MSESPRISEELRQMSYCQSYSILDQIVSFAVAIDSSDHFSNRSLRNLHGTDSDSRDSLEPKQNLRYQNKLACRSRI